MRTYEVKARVTLIVECDDADASTSDATEIAENILNDIDEATDVDITDVDLVDSDDSEDEAA